MKIAYLSTFPPLRGGIAHFNEKLSHHLAERGHQVFKITFARQYPNLLFPGKTQYIEGWRHREWEARQWLDTMNPINWWRTARRIRALNPDLLFLRYWIPFMAPSLGTVAAYLRAKGVPAVTIADNVIPHERRPGDMALTRWFLRRMAGVIVMSKTVERQLADLNLDVPYRRLWHPVYDHFPPPIPKEQARRRLGLPAGAPVVLFTGLIRPYKGLDLLIEAMTHWPPHYHLLIGGEVYGDERRYMQLIEQLGLADRVSARFHFLSDEEMALFWSAADVAVLPYRHATQSGILAIAYHYERPLVVTPVGDLPEAVRTFGVGAVAVEVSAAAVARAVREVIAAGPEHYTKNLRAARERLSWPRFAAEVERWMNEVVGRK